MIYLWDSKLILISDTHQKCVEPFAYNGKPRDITLITPNSPHTSIKGVQP